MISSYLELWLFGDSVTSHLEVEFHAILIFIKEALDTSAVLYFISYRENTSLPESITSCPGLRFCYNNWKLEGFRLGLDIL